MPLYGRLEIAMIPRYSGTEMGEIWTDTSRFVVWRSVELAVLQAREDLGQIPPGTTRVVQESTGVDDKVAEVINRRDKGIGHDLNAFVEVMRLQLCYPDSVGKLSFKNLVGGLACGEYNHDAWQEAFDELFRKAGAIAEAGWFHDGMTSYDTQEPATALLFDAACNIVLSQLSALMQALWERAQRHRGELMIGRTHGQHAQPITFGVKCLNWLEALRIEAERFDQARGNMRVMKLSGAVGMYGTLGPAVEARVGQILRLEPVIATQIISLNRRAHVIQALAGVASVIEMIARDLWLLSQTEIGEIREPFGKRQKGSSAMPHKKNPITLEQLYGLPRAVRGYATAMLENVATAHERDISHSSVERIVVPDAFGLTDHMLRRLILTIEGMEVFPERMLKNIQRSLGTYASQKVEMLLKEHGVSAEKAYRVVQAGCHKAVCEQRFLREVLLEHPLYERILRKKVLDQVFDIYEWVKEEDAIYERFAPENGY